MTPANSNRRACFADELARDTQDAWSAGRYANWRECARALESCGCTRLRAETILRSKVSRWAADHFETVQHQATASDLLAFIEIQPDAVRAAIGR